MVRHYRIAGIGIQVSVPDDWMYRDERELAPFVHEPVTADWELDVRTTEELPEPEGELIFRESGKRIYYHQDQEIRYIGSVEQGWQNAYLWACCRENRVQTLVKQDELRDVITPKVVMNALCAEHMIAKHDGFLLHASYILHNGRAILFTAPSGTGKSTLLKELVKNKNQAIQLGRFVKIAYYDQENANLDQNESVLAELWGRHVSWDQTRVRNILAAAGLVAEDMEKQVRMLSGGERAKLALAVFACEQGNFLILDEPTNHLDLPARESLESALKAFDGTVLFVSHDRYFIRALAGKILELDGKTATAYPYDYDTYTATKQTEKKPLASIHTPALSTNSAPKNEYYQSKEERAEKARKQTRVKKIETEISRLEAEESDLNADLSKPEITSNFPLLSQKCARLEEIHAALETLYQEYEQLLS